MNWKRLTILTAATMLTGVLCVTAAQAAVVDKTAPYEGEYFLAYNSRSGWANDAQSGTMPTNLLLKGLDPLTEEAPANEADVIHVRTDETGQEIYQMEPRNLTDRIKPPMRKFSFYANRPTVPPAIGDERTFITINTETDKSEETPFILKYDGENCNIWLEKEDKHNITDEMVTELGAEYDYYIHHPVQNAFGQVYDRNGDGKMAIFLYDIQDGYNGTSVRSYVGGFFMPADLVGTEFNNMDVLHIDTYPSINMGESDPLAEVKSTMVHELQHLIEESACIESDPAHPGQIRFKYESLPTWINEGLSMAAEHMFYGALDSRIDYYNSWDYHINTPLADWETGDDLSHYALSYLFIQYLRTQTKNFTGGGEELYKYIIQSPKRSALCVENAMKQFYPYISLNDIFRNFYIALTLKEPEGLYGFGGETAFDGVEVKIYDEVSSVYLGPGAAIVSRMSSGSYTPDQDLGYTVRYAGFKTSDAAQVDMPLSNLPSGETFAFRTLNLACAERNATIYYTVDGSEPTAETGLIYNGKPIQLLSDTTLKAVTVAADGRKSAVASYEYTITKEDVELFRRTMGIDVSQDYAYVNTYTAVLAPDGDIIQIATANDDAFEGGEFSELPFPDGKAYTVLVVSKYGQNGTLKWNRIISGSWAMAAFDTVSLEDGFVVVGGGNEIGRGLIGDFGELTYPNDASGIYSSLFKVSWDGGIQWISTFPNKKNIFYLDDGSYAESEATRFSGAAACPDGGIVAAGYANYYIDGGFGKEIHPAHGSTSQGEGGDALIAKVDGQGKLLWKKVIEGEYISGFHDVAVLADGTIVAVGIIDPRAIGTGDWASCPPVDRSIRSVPLTVAFDQEGEVLWMETFPYGNDSSPSFSFIDPVEGGFVASGSFVGRFQADKSGCLCLWHDETFNSVGAMTLSEDGILVAVSAYNSGLPGANIPQRSLGMVKYDFDSEEHTPIWQQRYGSNFFPERPGFQTSVGYATLSLLPLGGRKYAASGNAHSIYLSSEIEDDYTSECLLGDHSFLMIFYDESTTHYTVSGNVGRPGVSIGGKLSDSQGNYLVKVIEGESVTLTPTLNGYTFEPASRTVGPVTGPVTGVDFIPTEIKYTVSGTILDPDGKPLAGVTVAKGVVTGVDGKYSLQVRPGVNVILAPSLEGKVFEPASRTITGISGDAPDQDFRVPRPRFKVSGTITRDGLGQGGVELGGTRTGPDGRYQIVVEEGDSLTLTPQFFRYKFTPVSIPLTNILADMADQNFTMLLSPVVLTAPTPVSLGEAEEGYASPAAATVKVSNLGEENCTGLTVRLPENSSYTLTALSSTTLAAGGSATFTVTPREGLAAGSYSETVTVTDGEHNVEVTVTFRVTAKAVTPGPDGPGPDKPDPDKPDPDKPDPDKPDPDKPDPDKPDPDKPDPDKPDPDKPDPDKPDPDKPDPDKPDDPGGDDDDEDDDPPSSGSSGGTSSRPSKPSKPSTSKPAPSQEKPVQTVDLAPYVNGYEDGAFLPEANLTRGQCAAILTRLMGGFEPGRSYGKLSFPDVRADAWYYDHIGYMTTKGFIKGYPDGTFRPDEPITRAEFSILVRNALRLENASECSFPDVQTHWALAPVGQLTQAGILDGYPDGSFRPDAPISRAEAVKVLNGAYHRSPVRSDFDGLEAPFTDLYPSHWAYYDILEAALEHKHTME